MSTDRWDREAWAATEESLAAQLVLWHGHGGFSYHTHVRGDDWHVHREEIRGKVKAWQTVWEDGEVAENIFPP